MKIIVTLFLSFMFLGSNNSALAQWADAGGYEQILKSKLPKVVDLHLCYSKEHIYFTDRSSIYQLNIQSGKTDLIASPPSNNNIDAFDIDSAGKTLYYCTDTILYSYDIAEKKVTDSIVYYLYGSGSKLYLRIMGNKVYLSPDHKLFGYVNWEDSYKVFSYQFDINPLKRNTNPINSGLICSISKDRNSIVKTSRSYSYNSTRYSYEYKYSKYIHIYNQKTNLAVSQRCYYDFHYKNPGNENSMSFSLLLNNKRQFDFLESVDSYIFSDTSNLYLSDLKHWKTLVNPYSLTIEEIYDYQTIPVGKFDRFAVDKDEGFIAYTNIYNNRVYLFNIQVGTLVDSIQLNEKLRDIIATDDDYTYLVESDSSIYKISFIVKCSNSAKIIASTNYEQISKTISFKCHTVSKFNSFKWKFSDGEEYFGESISRAFSNPGNYSVQVTAKNDSCDLVSYAYSIVMIKPMLRASFKYRIINPEKGIYGFVSTSVGNITKLRWEFGDETNSDKGSIIKTFKSIGKMSVKLTVWDNNLKDSIEFDSLVSVSYSINNLKITEIFAGIDSSSHLKRILDATPIDNDNLLIEYSDDFDRTYLAIFNLHNKSVKTLTINNKFLKILNCKDTIFIFSDNKLYYYDDGNIKSYMEVRAMDPIEIPKVYNNHIVVCYSDCFYYISERNFKIYWFDKQKIENSGFQVIGVDLWSDESIGVLYKDSNNIVNLSKSNLNSNEPIVLSPTINKKYSFYKVSSFVNNDRYILSWRGSAGTEFTDVVDKDSKIINQFTLNLRQGCILNSGKYYTIPNSIPKLFLDFTTLDSNFTNPVHSYVKVTSFDFEFKCNNILNMPDRSILFLGNDERDMIIFIRVSAHIKTLQDDYNSELIEPPINSNPDPDPDPDPDPVDLLNQITVFPNPNIGELKVRLDISESTDVTISIFDSMGNKVFSLLNENMAKGIITKIFDISALHPGFYYMQIFIGGKQYVRKVVKQ